MFEIVGKQYSLLGGIAVSESVSFVFTLTQYIDASINLFGEHSASFDTRFVKGTLSCFVIIN